MILSKLHTLNAGDTGSIPVWETKMPHGQKIKLKSSKIKRSQSLLSFATLKDTSASMGKVFNILRAVYLFIPILIQLVQIHSFHVILNVSHVREIKDLLNYSENI